MLPSVEQKGVCSAGLAWEYGRVLGRSREDLRFYPHHSTRFKDSAYSDFIYEAVQDVYEGKRAFFLLLEGKQSMILPKGCFVQGEPGAFRRFMDEKCGKAVIKV